MTKNKKYMVISIVVAIIMVISSCYLLLPKDSYDYSFYYYVEICNIGIPVNSSVIVPMPDFQEDEIDWTELLLAESTKRGEMNITVVNTDYGKGLMINSTGRCIISFNSTIQVPAQDLTMDNENIGNKFYVMNYHNSSITIDVDFYNYEIIDSVRHGPYEQIYIYNSPNGWFDSADFIHVSENYPTP